MGEARQKKKYRGNRRRRIAILLAQTPFFPRENVFEVERIVTACHGVYRRGGDPTVMAVLNFCFKNRHVINKATTWMEVVLKAIPHSAMQLSTVAQLAPYLQGEMQHKEAKKLLEKATPGIPLSRAIH